MKARTGFMIFLSALIGALLFVHFLPFPRHLSSTQLAFANPTALSITNLQANSISVGLYEKFELTFQIQGSVASNPYFPYDPNPPRGVPAGVGITVNGEFSPDNWNTLLVQPAFLYQEYQRQCIGDPANDCKNGEEWLYPVGEMVWKIRFAPQELGNWRYRVRATDASGSVVSTEGSFTVIRSTARHNHGFIRISPKDSGYFEYSDGTPFIGMGHGSGFNSGRFTYDVDADMRLFEANRVNFIRVWMSGNSIYMAPWHPWNSHHLPHEGGYFTPASLSYQHSYADHLFALRLWDYNDSAISNRRNPCMFQGFANNVAVKPNTTYRLWVRAKLIGVSGPRNAAYPYGFTIRKGGWLGEQCSNPASTSSQSTRLLTPQVGNGTWQEFSTTFTTAANEHFLSNFYLILENTTGGDAFVDEVSVREVLPGGGLGPEILRKNRFAYHLYFDQQPSWQWDYAFEKAAESGVTIRPVVLEKNDWIANHMDADGNLVGEYYDVDNNRFYAAPNTPIRRYHEYFWRYLIARWGYSRAVHSWELLNEGDPYNGNHYAQADAFGRFMKANDPHRHLVTTSTWHNFPIKEFWGNPQYSGVDYADIHQYACCGSENLLYGWIRGIRSPLSLEDRPAYVYGGKGRSVRIPGAVQFNNEGGTPRHLVIRGRGEWVIRFRMKAQNFQGTCPYGAPNSLAGPRLLWLLDDGTEGRANVVPPDPEGKTFVCSSPAGTYDWRTYDSQTTHDNRPAPPTARILINDDKIHSLAIYFQNGFGTGGEAWIDNVELISPSGERMFLNGEFDDTLIIHDTALLTAALSLELGGRMRTGPSKPVTRGEVGIWDDEGDWGGDENSERTRDTQGIWLHNLIWGQINPGGLIELYWDAYNIRQHNLYHHFKAFRNFMDGIPLTNGRYEDARATTTDENLRAWGQVDRIAHRGHLWIHHRLHTWKNVLDGIAIPPIQASITIPNLTPGIYQVEWWDTYQGSVLQTQVVPANDETLTLTLPQPLTTDIAVKFSRTLGGVEAIYLPLVLKSR